MKKYEALFIVKPDLSDDERKALFVQLGEAITKKKGVVVNAGVWGEKRKLYFPLKRYREGLYYLINFEAAPLTIDEIRHAYRLNENILRVLIIVQE
jgi:small subunit ribosomal protein S6